MVLKLCHLLAPLGLTALLAAPAGAQPPANLLKNGSFEGGTRYWYEIGGKQLIHGDAAQGEYAIHIPKGYLISAVQVLVGDLPPFRRDGRQVERGGGDRLRLDVAFLQFRDSFRCCHGSSFTSGAGARKPPSKEQLRLLLRFCSCEPSPARCGGAIGWRESRSPAAEAVS
jgi:hypothetical protein